MFLTRIGFGAKAVITGDISQIDLPRNIKRLKDARKLRDVEGLYFTPSPASVVRHPLCRKSSKPMKQKNKLKRKRRIIFSNTQGRLKIKFQTALHHSPHNTAIMAAAAFARIGSSFCTAAA